MDMPSENAGNVVVALAQLPVIRGAVADNLTTHLRYVERAAQDGADVIVFPELSLIGYEPDLLEALAMASDAEVFKTLSAAAVENNMAVIAGCPLINDGGKPRIGAVICFPDGARTFYAKQHLHDGEEAYCSPDDEACLFTVNGVRIALAICADFAHTIHSDAVAAQKAAVYLASVLISDGGYEADAQCLAGIARRHGMPVLFSNHISDTGGWQTCGRSGGWNARGARLVGASGREACLVIAVIRDGVLEGASGRVIAMDSGA